MHGITLTSGIDINFLEDNLMNTRFREDHLEGDNILNRDSWPDNAAFHSVELVREAQANSTYTGPNRATVFYAESREAHGTVWPLQQYSHFNCGNPAVFLPRQRQDTMRDRAPNCSFNVPLDLCLQCATASLNTGTWPRYRTFNSGRPISSENRCDGETHYNQYENGRHVHLFDYLTAPQFEHCHRECLACNPHPRTASSFDLQRRGLDGLRGGDQCAHDTCTARRRGGLHLCDECSGMVWYRGELICDGYPMQPPLSQYHT
jgi:hypothetical protein